MRAYGEPTQVLNMRNQKKTQYKKKREKEMVEIQVVAVTWDAHTQHPRIYSVYASKLRACL